MRGFLLTTWLVVRLGAATTYCVSNSGSDSNSGTATGPNCTGVVSPWQTIAHVNSQNCTTFAPGTTISFQSGGVWREELFLNCSGASGNPVTFSSYGVGALPIISGANVLTGFSQIGSTNVWTKTVATQPNVLIFNGTPGVLQASQGAVTSIYTWYYSGTTLYVYSVAGDPSSTYAPLEAGQRSFGIIGNPASYVTINGIQTQYANNSGIACFSGCSTIIVEKSISLANYYFGITATNSTGNDHLLIAGNTVGWNGSSGILVSGTGNSDLIQSNTAYNNAWGGTWTVDMTFNTGTGIRMFGNGVMSNCIEQFNTSYNNGLGPTGIWNTQGEGQSPQDLEDGGGIMFDTMGTGNIMRFNVTYNNEVGGLRVTADSGTLVYMNVSYGNVQQTESTIYSGMGADLDFGINGTQFYNNTLYGNQIGLLVQGNVSPIKTVVNLLAQNNLVVGSLMNALSATFGGDNDGMYGSGNQYIYNAFGVQSTNFIQWGFENYYATYSSWETAAGNCGTTNCSHSLETAVPFVNANSGDFRLPRGSAALTAGSAGGIMGGLGVVQPSLLNGVASITGVGELQ
jgi:hypothetical protein